MTLDSVNDMCHIDSIVENFLLGSNAKSAAGLSTDTRLPPVELHVTVKKGQPKSDQKVKLATSQLSTRMVILERNGKFEDFIVGRKIFQWSRHYLVSVSQ